MRAKTYDIDPERFWQDPYPDLAAMRRLAAVVYVPQLDAFLMTRRDDIFREEKKTDVFSSVQPKGLMTLLMGENMMRKDGADHMAERRAIFPTVSPKTVQRVWREGFRARTAEILEQLQRRGSCDLVADFALPVSAEALKLVTGLSSMSALDMDRVSQGMIDGCANYKGDPAVEANCNLCTAEIDRAISEEMARGFAEDDLSLLAVQLRAGLPEEQVRANIKLAISGGQNEPRDAIAGTAWALLTHTAQLDAVLGGEASWLQAFEEYARWISPIGMSPRRVAQPYEIEEARLLPEDRVFLMFGSGNRDERRFSNPEGFDLFQDCSPSLSFGAGPHFCAGAWISKALIAEAALPMLFEYLPKLELNGEVPFGGWAFRGPQKVPVHWAAAS
ncbi:cytochrome P450 family protein [Roseobacter sp. SK209-2-6]|uniref:cytochrome P450 n=1 Tax=Roseobacter sp. SK209-2-6 TaxID=388739 RepID=UPI0000F3EE09|nr:cytochrome P450 [Roseobacter sp. SK209-2-6]EBA16737.1 cytochrome P450 family protein [Roseobacter sp. SK209-2-6]